MGERKDVKNSSEIKPETDIKTEPQKNLEDLLKGAKPEDLLSLLQKIKPVVEDEQKRLLTELEQVNNQINNLVIKKQEIIKKLDDLGYKTRSSINHTTARSGIIWKIDGNTVKSATEVAREYGLNLFEGLTGSVNWNRVLQTILQNGKYGSVSDVTIKNILEHVTFEYTQ
jgi:hypothetical protein